MFKQIIRLTFDTGDSTSKPTFAQQNQNSTHVIYPNVYYIESHAIQDFRKKEKKKREGRSRTNKHIPYQYSWIS